VWLRISFANLKEPFNDVSRHMFYLPSVVKAHTLLENNNHLVIRLRLEIVSSGERVLMLHLGRKLNHGDHVC